MKYVQFGSSGYQVSRLGFGAMRFPMTDDKKCVDFDTAVPVLQRALDLGVNIIDSHPLYCSGFSETTIGKAIQGYNRSSFYIVTKSSLHIPLEEGQTFRSRLEGSLKRLQTDYIDFYLTHSLKLEDFQKLGPQFFKEMEQARSEGLIRHLGFSSHDKPENILQYIDSGLFEALLVQYNLIDYRNAEALAHAHAKGLGTMVMGPVGGGRLATPTQITRMIGGDSADRSVEMCLRFVWNNTNVNVAMSGMGSIEQVEQNVALASTAQPLNNADLQEVERVLKEKQRVAELYCTSCAYCLPCPHNVAIPGIFLHRNNFVVYNMEEYARKSYKEFREVYNAGADKCVACGACEKKCPQHIPIITQLRECHELFTGEKLPQKETK